ncbi:MAG TPA: hypothetical protein VMP08_26160 [Anaerolineae bacterium]|nr:hypothetical protein [Anaerolineae bacterium]
MSEDIYVQHKRFTQQAGALYGALVALGFVLFLWLPDAVILRQAHVSGWWAKLVVGLIVTLPVSTLIGWLAASMRWSGLSLLIWIVGGSILAWIAGHVPFEGVSWLVRLTDRYPSDRVPYPFTASAGAYTGISMVVGAGAGLLLGLLAMFATERAWEYSTRSQRFSLKSILVLCLCLPIMLAFGLLVDFQMDASARDALTAVAHVIETVRDPNADLVKARLTPMLNYQGHLSPNYTLHLNAMDSELVNSAVDVQFDNGLLLRCPYAYGVVVRCENLSDDLAAALTELTRDGQLTCDNCGIEIERSVLDWLGSNRSALGNLQHVEVARHHEAWIYMRATFDSGRQIDCRFNGDRPIVVDLCMDVK